MDYKWVKLSKLDRFKKFELNIPSDRVFSGLSENHTENHIKPTELKLWPFIVTNLSPVYMCVCVYISTYISHEVFI